MSSLRWTLKSTYTLARELADQGFEVSAELVRRLLHQMGYSLQGTSKQNEGRTHPDRDGQFNHLNDAVTERLAAGEPVISVDTKKKELIGNFSNNGRQWQPAGEPERTLVHDFPDPSLGEFAKAIPYGIYDIANNEGWVNVGDSFARSGFATAAPSSERLPLFDFLATPNTIFTAKRRRCVRPSRPNDATGGTSGVRVKPDVMIVRWVQDTLGRTVRQAGAAHLVEASTSARTRGARSEEHTHSMCP